ncbi:MAG TPA: hypothetical protein VF619_02275 [Allosphingosinicella sp.]|jgi:hypothetical protein
MNRFLTLMMIVVLLIAHGSSVSAAICRHASGTEHEAALQSRDKDIRTVAHSEDAAGKVAAKRGSPSDSGSVSWPADMLPTPGLPLPLALNEPVERGPADAPALVGTSLRPLLEPPSA